MHWKSSARTGRLLVREYEDELARRVVIAVDNALPADVRDAIAASSESTSAPIGPWSSGASAPRSPRMIRDGEETRLRPPRLSIIRRAARA